EHHALRFQRRNGILDVPGDGEPDGDRALGPRLGPVSRGMESDRETRSGAHFGPLVAEPAQELEPERLRVEVDRAVEVRPLYGRVAARDHGSLRVFKSPYPTSGVNQGCASPRLRSALTLHPYDSPALLASTRRHSPRA